MDILGNVIARPKCMFILNLDITKWIQMSPNSICEFMCVCVCVCALTLMCMRVCAPSYIYLSESNPGLYIFKVCTLPTDLSLWPTHLNFINSSPTLSTMIF